MVENNIWWWDGSEESARQAYNGHPKMAEAFGSFENYLEYLNAYSDMLASTRDSAAELLENSPEYQAVVDAGGLLQYAGQIAASGEEFQGVSYLTDIQNLWKEQSDALLEQYAPGFSFETFQESDGDRWSWNGSQWVRYEQGSDSGWDVFSDLLSAAGFAFIGGGLGSALGGAIGAGGAGGGLEAALPTFGAGGGSTIGGSIGAGAGLFAPTSGSGAGPGVPTGSYGIDDPSQFTQMLVDTFGPGLGGTGSLDNWQDFAEGLLTGNLDLIKNSISVLVPSIPTGLPLPPSMMVLGTIGQILSNPGALVQQQINQLLDIFVTRDANGNISGIQNPQDLLGSLGGFIQDAYEDMPPDQIPPIILAGILANEYGQDAYDWLKDQFGYGDESVESYEEFLEENALFVGGEEEEDESAAAGGEQPEGSEEAEPFDRVEDTADLLEDYTSMFGSTIPDAGLEQEEVEEGFDRTEQVSGLLPQFIGAVGGSQEQEEEAEVEQEDPLSGAEEQQEDGFTFGGGSFVENDELTEEEIQELLGQYVQEGGPLMSGGEDILENQTEEETPLTGTTGGGGGGGGGARSPSYDFMARLNYQLPQIAPIIGSSVPTMQSGMFSQRKSRQKGLGLQLGNITESLFGRYI